MDKYCVYKHTSPSGKVYIGITLQNPRKRWKNGYGYRTQQYFYRAIQKYGWDNFEHEVVFSDLTENVAKCKEMSLIQLYQSNNKNYGYNSTLGGDGCVGRIPSEETRLKWCEAMTKEMKRKLVEANQSDKARAKRISTMRKRPQEYYLERNKHRRKPVRQCDPITGETINVFPSAVEAEKQTGTRRQDISACIKGRQKTANGFRWILLEGVQSCV